MTDFAPGNRVRTRLMGNGTVFCTKQKGGSLTIVVKLDDFSYLLDNN